MLNDSQKIIDGLATEGITLTVEKIGDKFFRAYIRGEGLWMRVDMETYSRAVYMGAIKWNKNAPAALYRMNIDRKEKFFNLTLANGCK